MNMIVMMDKNGCIGINNDQPIHLKYDLNRFKSFTISKTVVCGRKTVETFPNGIPLKNRNTIVISSTLKPNAYAHLTDRFVTVVNHPFEVVKKIQDSNSSDMFIIGGASIYRQLIPWTNRVYATIADLDFARVVNIKKNNAVYFPIDVLNSSFDIINEHIIMDKDLNTNAQVHTKFIEYVRV